MFQISQIIPKEIKITRPFRTRVNADEVELGSRGPKAILSMTQGWGWRGSSIILLSGTGEPILIERH